MFGKYVDQVRKEKPLIHNITNYVTVNDVANVLLAIGGSPIMADDKLEVEEITSLCNGLVINIGTLNQRTIESMKLAATKAKELNHALVLDPVGAGASSLRTKTALDLINQTTFDVIRGNLSEIKTLMEGQGKTQGVDASADDNITEDNIDELIHRLGEFSKEMGSIIAVTGAVDIITDGTQGILIYNGKKEMGQITGTGCQLSALIGAFVAANPKNKLEATAAAIGTMGLAGDLAFEALQEHEGNISYRNRIIDTIYHMKGKDLDQGVQYDIKR
ncbi:MAG: hydroxyethylthiazole kinase [Tissierellia bacterium]|nr:hydroxyethylthiazole kinase [Tissierellia bacterium]